VCRGSGPHADGDSNSHTSSFLHGHCNAVALAVALTDGFAHSFGHTFEESNALADSFFAR